MEAQEYQYEFNFEGDPEKFISDFLAKITAERGSRVNFGDFTYELAQIFILNDNERKRQGVPCLTDTQKYLITYFFHKTAELFAEKTRHTGESYFFEHLVDTVKLGIVNQGKIGLGSMLSRVLHDLIEDVKNKKPEYRDYTVDQFWQMVFDDAVLREVIQGYSVVEAERIMQGVKKEVLAVTKIKVPEDRSLTNDLAFYILLRELYNDLNAAGVKIDDRCSNARSFDVFDEEKRKKMTKETLDLYLPLAQILKKDKSAQFLLESCLKYDNPNLLKNFEKLREERMSRLRLKATELEDVLSGVDKVVKVEVVPRDLLYYLPQDVDFENLVVEDLKIPSDDLMCEVLVQVMPLSRYYAEKEHNNAKSEKVEKIYQERRTSYLDDIAGKVLRELKHVGIAIPVESKLVLPSAGFRRWKGLSGHVIGESLGGKLELRVNDVFHEARSKRGLEVFGSRPPNAIRGLIDTILKSVKTDFSGSPDLNSVRGLIGRAKELLLLPRITVYTNQKKQVEMLQGSTVLDFARVVHRDLLLGIQHAVKITNDDETIVEIDEPLVDGASYSIESCLKKNDSRNEKIKVDPSWLLWAKTSEARQIIRKYLRGEYEKFPVTSETTIHKGEEFLYSIYSLLGNSDINSNNWDEILNEHNIDMEDFYYQVGTGDINVLQTFVSNFKEDTASNRDWRIDVDLPDKSGALRDFINLLVKFLKVDIGGDEMTFRQKEKQKTVKLSFRTREGLSMFDFFRELIRIQNYGYEMRIMNKFIYKLGGGFMFID